MRIHNRYRELISDDWRFLFGVAGAVGSIATAAALFFLGWQALLTRAQLRTRRAWIASSKITIEFNQVVFFCRNYGELPAKILFTKSAVSDTTQLTETDIRAAQGNLETTIIFPDNEHLFHASGSVEIPAFQEKRIWFGFIVEYKSISGSIGEYGVIGEVHQTRIASETSKAREWFVKPGKWMTVVKTWSKFFKALQRKLKISKT